VRDTKSGKINDPESNRLTSDQKSEILEKWHLLTSFQYLE
jgi:hypothetical protein